MNVGDVLMFIPHGTINSQVWENTHFYLVDGLSLPLNEGEFQDILEAWATWYQTNVVEAADNIFHVQMNWTGVRGENLFNVAELGATDYTPALIGSATGDALAQNAAYGFSTPSRRRGMNSGQRRMAGVPESLVTNFGYVNAEAAVGGDIISDAFSAVVDLSFRGGLGEVTILPVIVKRVRTGSGTPADPYEYALPRVVADRVTYTANAWSLKPQVTTQNSRKVGRGS